jgi:hypothetical protein
MTPAREKDSHNAKYSLQMHFGIYDETHLDMIESMTTAHFNECMFSATMAGNFKLMNLLWWHRGPFALAYENKPGFDSQFLNGVEFMPSTMQHLLLCQSIQKIKQLFLTIKAFGFKGILEPGLTYPYLFRRAGFLAVEDEIFSCKFKGILPNLTANTLNEPDLAIQMTEESSRSAFPEGYQPILCWASEEMIAQYSTQLMPLRTLQRVTYRNRVSVSRAEPVQDLFDVSMAEFKAIAKPAIHMKIETITLGLNDSCTRDSQASLLAFYMAGAESRFGFADEDGWILCQTRTDFLMGFPAGPSNPDNLLACETFVADYLPLDIISNQIKSICKDQFGYDRENATQKIAKDVNSRELIHTYKGHSTTIIDVLQPKCGVVKKARDMMRLDQWQAMIKASATTNMDVEKLIAVRDVLGMSNEDLRFVLKPADIDVLHAANYRFSDKTKVLPPGKYAVKIMDDEPDETLIEFQVSEKSLRNIENYDDEELIEEVVRLHALSQKMGLWTGVSTQPASVKVALDMIGELPINDADNRDSVAIMGWLSLQGVVACANAATQPSHWQRMLEIFGAENLTPYLAMLPRDIRGRVLEEGLGL